MGGRLAGTHALMCHCCLRAARADRVVEPGTGHHPFLSRPELLTALPAEIASV